ncbi:MAG: creatininase family protein [Kiritimatiellia bacterium]|nr:creatininase family protein [Lentisphaerota bacterium]
MPGGILQEMTIDMFDGWRPEVVVIGVGSTEPHGPHLPYGTDFMIVDGIARRATIQANEQGGRVMQYPSLPVGCNVNFKPFPFAARMKVRTLMSLLGDIIEALEEDGVRKILLLNGHGGNTSVVEATLREHFERHPADPQGRRAFVCTFGTNRFVEPEVKAMLKHPSPHGGEDETARMMGLRPDLVRPEYFREFPIVPPSASGVAECHDNLMYVKPWHLFLPEAAGGETRTVTREMGERLVESAAKGLAEFMVRLSRAPWHANFPFDPPAGP